jgi:hypothetical protein
MQNTLFCTCSWLCDELYHSHIKWSDLFLSVGYSVKAKHQSVQSKSSHHLGYPAALERQLYRQCHRIRPPSIEQGGNSQPSCLSIPAPRILSLNGIDVPKEKLFKMVPLQVHGAVDGLTRAVNTLHGQSITIPATHTLFLTISIL